jgi:hypothetical protein
VLLILARRHQLEAGVELFDETFPTVPPVEQFIESGKAV